MKKTFYFCMALTAIIVAMGSCKPKDEPVEQQAVLSVSPKVLEFDGSKSQAAKVFVTATSHWIVQDGYPDWIHVSPMDVGNGSDTLTIRCHGGEENEYKLVFEMDELTDTLHVIRHAAVDPGKDEPGKDEPGNDEPERVLSCFPKTLYFSGDKSSTAVISLKATGNWMVAREPVGVCSVSPLEGTGDAQITITSQLGDAATDICVFKMGELFDTLTVVRTGGAAPQEESNVLMPGLFSVSATKQVQFTRGNLIWDLTHQRWGLMADQFGTSIKYMELRGDSIGFFKWATSASEAVGRPNQLGTCSPADRHFCDGLDAAHTLSIGDASSLYLMSKEEWTYLLEQRPRASNLARTSRSASGGWVIVIAPDNYTGTLQDTYSLSDMRMASEDGVVFLYPFGRLFLRDSEYQSASEVQYMSSTLRSTDETNYYALMVDTGTKAPRISYYGRLQCMPMRLVQAVQ